MAVDKFDETGLILTAKAPLMPEVTLGEYKGLQVEKYTEELDEKKVEKQLNHERERGARFVEAPEGTEAKLGDFVTIDFTGSVDGKEFETQTGKTIFKFNVPITGEHTITAIADSCTDNITVKKVEKENPDYIFVKRSPITNWFDADELDPECFSINDKLAEIKANPKAGAIIDEMMAKGASERGDVADAVKDNPGLQRMMGRMTLVSLLKQSGADEESIKQINRILQGIKKEN